MTRTCLRPTVVPLLALAGAVAIGLGCGSCGGGEPSGGAGAATEPGGSGTGAGSEPASAAGPAAEAAEPASGSAASLMEELRSRLDALADLEPSDPVNRGGDIDVGPLVGLTRDQLRAGLGDPHDCTEDASRDSQGNAIPVAPCQTRRDWFYSFYRLPDGWLGGGPELLLTFDANDTCTSAVWRYTQ